MLTYAYFTLFLMLLTTFCHVMTVKIESTGDAEETVDNESHLSQLNQKLAALKHHYWQSRKGTKDFLHSFHHAQQSSLQYSAQEDDKPSDFTGGLKSFPPPNGSQHKKDKGTDEHLMRKKRSLKGNLDDVIFEHIMTKYLHHGTPLHIHEHGASSSAAVHTRQLVMRPYTTKLQHLHVPRRKQPHRKLGFHLGIPALSLILHISPTSSNHTNLLTTQPTAESAKTSLINTQLQASKQGEKTDETFSILSKSTPGLFFNSSPRPKMNQYEVHEDDESRYESQAKNPSITNLQIPSKLQEEDKNLTNKTYDTAITTPSVDDEIAERQIGEKVTYEEMESLEGLGNKQESSFRDSMESLVRSESHPKEVSRTESYERNHPDQNEHEYLYQVAGKNYLGDEDTEDLLNFRDAMDATTELDNRQTESEVEDEEEGITPNEDEFYTEASTDVPVAQENELKSNESQPDDSLIRSSRLIIPNQFQMLDVPATTSSEPPGVSDLLSDSEDALLPVIPIIIHDLREGRVSNADRNILSQVFGERWANIEMRANKSHNINHNLQRVDRAFNVSQGEENIRSKRSSEYSDALSEYFDERHEGHEEYAYEDDAEWEEGPDVSELLHVARGHINWKTHKDLHPK